MIILGKSDHIFIAGCAIVYSVVTLSIPSYIPLLDADSNGYLTFDSTRTALYPAFLHVCKLFGLGLIEITWVQVFVFGLALAFLLRVLLRAGFPRVLLAAFVVMLAGNILFTSFHRSILTESLFFSFGVIATALWIDYFRTGRLLLLIWAGLVLGLMIGIRPAGIALVPVQFLAVLIGRPNFLSKWALVFVAMIPVGIGAGSERLMYGLVHDGPAKSTAPLLFMGKAAMLAKPDMKFTGPHERALTAVGTQLVAVSIPMQRNLVEAPSLPVRIVLSAPYEGQAQAAEFLSKELSDAAKEGKTTVDALRVELGKQAILQNIPGYIKLTLLTEIGQWSVSAQRFPPTARMTTAYAESKPAVALGSRIAPEILHPPPSSFAYIVYPAFLVAGVVTLVLAFGAFVFIARPMLMEGAVGFYLGIAVFLSALCHGYTLFISLSNVWTPRFLMAVVPQIEIVALCLLLIILHRCKLIVLQRPV